LRCFLHQPVELRRRRLVKTRLIGNSEHSNGLEQAQRSYAINIGRVLGRFEGDSDMALGSKIINLVWLGLLHETNEIGRIRHIPVVKVEANAGEVRISVKVINTL